MKLDTVARAHAEEVHHAAQSVPIPAPETVVGRRRPSRRLLAAATAGAVATVSIIAAVLFSSGDERVTPTTLPAAGESSTTTTTAPLEGPTVDDLREAVAAAVGVLRNADGLEGIQTASRRGYLAYVTWFSARKDGSESAVRWTDLDITEGVWTEGVPFATGERLEQAVYVLIGDLLYIGDPANDGWAIMEEAPNTLALVLLGREDPFSLQSVAAEAAVTTGKLPEGGTVWNLVAPFEGGDVVQRFEIRPDGSVAWSAQTTDATIPLDLTDEFTAVSIEYRVLVDPDPIPRTPRIPPSAYPGAVGAPADLASLWQEFDQG
jgi:hypothetical protein